MKIYSWQTARNFQDLSADDNWLRIRQPLALLVLSPCTPEAKKFFFSNIQQFAVSGGGGKSKIDYLKFAREWNLTADGKTRYYVTSEILEAYGKKWDKVNNIHASQELVYEHLSVLKQTQEIFQSPHIQFPRFAIVSTNPPLAIDHPRVSFLAFLILSKPFPISSLHFPSANQCLHSAFGTPQAQYTDARQSPWYSYTDPTRCSPCFVI